MTEVSYEVEVQQGKGSTSNFSFNVLFHELWQVLWSSCLSRNARSLFFLLYKKLLYCKLGDYDVA